MSHIDALLDELFGNDDAEEVYAHVAPRDVFLSGCEFGPRFKRRRTENDCKGTHGSAQGQAARGEAAGGEGKAAGAAGGGVLTDLASSRTFLLAGSARIVRPLPGLVIIRGALTTEQQLTLAAAILDSGCLVGETPAKPSRQQDRNGGVPNQAMFFGPLPQWGIQLSPILPLDQLLPSTLAAREPAFDQAIVNLYRPGEGITDHVDLARFQDGIVGVSVGGPVVMDFRRLPGARGAAGSGGDGSGDDGSGAAVEVGALGGRDVSAGQGIVPAAVAAAGYSREAVERLLQSDGGDDDEGQEPLHPESCPRDGVWWLEDEEAAAETLAEAELQAGEAPVSHHNLIKGRRRRHLRVLLQGGDLIGMSGEARYGWTHGIAQGVTHERVLVLPDRTSRENQVEEEKERETVGVLRHVPRGVRLSVTLRRLVPHIVLSELA